MKVSPRDDFDRESLFIPSNLEFTHFLIHSGPVAAGSGKQLRVLPKFRVKRYW